MRLPSPVKSIQAGLPVLKEENPRNNNGSMYLNFSNFKTLNMVLNKIEEVQFIIILNWHR